MSELQSLLRLGLGLGLVLVIRWEQTSRVELCVGTAEK